MGLFDWLTGPAPKTSQAPSAQAPAGRLGGVLVASGNGLHLASPFRLPAC